MAEYIITELKGTVGEEYAEPLGRITVDTENDPPAQGPETSDAVSVYAWLVLAVAALAGATVCIRKKKISEN